MSTPATSWHRLRSHLSIERPRSRRLQRGQVLPIFAVMAIVILGGAALLTDAAWWWVSQQRMQRAADAGALAGAIYLPGDRPTAFAKARAETAKNGFTDGAGGVDRHAQGRSHRPPQAHRRYRWSGVHQLRQGLLHRLRRCFGGRYRDLRAAGAHGQPPELLRRGLLPGRHPGRDDRHAGRDRLAAADGRCLRLVVKPQPRLRRRQFLCQQEAQRRQPTAGLRQLRYRYPKWCSGDRHRDAAQGVLQRLERLSYPRGRSLGFRLVRQQGGRPGGRPLWSDLAANARWQHRQVGPELVRGSHRER